jgi:hypothetical protein
VLVPKPASSLDSYNLDVDLDQLAFDSQGAVNAAHKDLEPGSLAYNTARDQWLRHEHAERLDACRDRAVLLLLHLFFVRLQQEYCEQLRVPEDRLFRALVRRRAGDGGMGSISLDDGSSMAESSAMGGLAEGSLGSIGSLGSAANDGPEWEELLYADPDEEPRIAVFRQFLQQCRPDTRPTGDWRSLNRRCAVQLVPALTTENMEAVKDVISSKSPLRDGTRVFLVTGAQASTDGLEDILKVPPLGDKKKKKKKAKKEDPPSSASESESESRPGSREGGKASKKGTKGKKGKKGKKDKKAAASESETETEVAKEESESDEDDPLDPTGEKKQLRQSLGSQLREAVQQWTCEIIPATPDETKRAKRKKTAPNRVIPKKERNVTFVCGSQRYGTRSLVFSDTEKGHSVQCHTVDSVFRNNEFALSAAELAAAAQAKSKASSSGGMSKKAIEKRKAEEAKAFAKAKEKLEAQISQQVPDGYVLLETQTKTFSISRDELPKEPEVVQATIPTADGEEPIEPPPPPPAPLEEPVTLAERKTYLMKSVRGGKEAEWDIYADPEQAATRPSPFAMLTPPPWLSTMSPGGPGTYFQDEVIILARDNVATSAALNQLEGADTAARIANMYQKSRLSELSRPEELREVDMSIPGVTEAFLKACIESIFADPEIITDSMRNCMFPLTDDFARGYCLARSLGEAADEVG